MSATSQDLQYNLIGISFISDLSPSFYHQMMEIDSPTSIGNILILEKVFATFNNFPLQNGFCVNNYLCNQYYILLVISISTFVFKVSQQKNLYIFLYFRKRQNCVHSAVHLQKCAESHPVRKLPSGPKKWSFFMFS